MADEKRNKEPKEETKESLDAALKSALTRGLQEKTDVGARVRLMEPGKARRKGLLNLNIGGLLGRVKPRDVFAFCEELSLLLEYGMPMVRALNTLANRIENPALARVVMDVGNTVERGGTFSEATTRHPRCFSPLIVNMFRAGERSGTLMETLHHVAEHGERVIASRHKALASLIYPFIIIVAAICVVTFAFSMFVDQYVPIMQSLGAEVPWMMAVLMKLATWWGGWTFWVVAAAIVVGVIVLYKLTMRVSTMRLLRDRFLVRCPGIRRFVKTSLVANFSRVFSTMLQAGVPLQETLQAVHDTTTNELLRLTMKRVEKAVSEGGRITPALERADLFPPVAYDLAAIGEEAGALDRVFARMADIFEEKLETDTAMIGKIAQPAIVILLACIVGFVVISLLSMYAGVLQQIQV